MATPRKSASLTVFHFDDSAFRTLVQNAQVNLQHCIDGYDKSVLLKEDMVSVGQTRPTVLLKPGLGTFLDQIVALTRQGYYIDIFFFTHGNDDKIYLAPGEVLTTGILKSALSSAKTGYEVYPIRSVCGVNCYGHTFNQTWLDLGAKVSCGARWVNFYPNRFNKFASEWKKGNVGFGEALRASNTESSRSVMQALIAGDAISKFNFEKCPFGKTVLGDHACARSYFDRNWLAADEWEHDKSGAENMDYSSYMFRVGLTDLTRNDMAPLRW
jgi:hypothetical protein